MCYSNCKNENNDGECTKTPDSNDTEVHCFDGFICEGCDNCFDEDENEKQTGFCIKCFDEWKLTKCNACGKYFEKMEIANGICPECLEVKNNTLNVR